jgi:microcystin-dependent protein
MAAIVADSYGPFMPGTPGQIMTLDSWSGLMRQMLTNGVCLGEGNLLEPYADSTGLQVKVKTGRAFLRGFGGEWTAEPVLAVGANGSGQTRIDLIVVRLNLSNQDLEIDIVPGTPSVNPIAHALTQNSTTWEEPLGQVRVSSGASTIGPASVTDARKFSRAAGIELGRPQPTFAVAEANVAELILDGRTVSRVTYAELLDVAPSLVAGPGDGVTTIQLVDLRGVTMAGRKAGDTDFGGALGSKIGEARHTLTEGEMPTHNHNGLTSNENGFHTHDFSLPTSAIDFLTTDTVLGAGGTKSSVPGYRADRAYSSADTAQENQFHQHDIGSDGSNAAHPVIQPTALVNWVIRAR